MKKLVLALVLVSGFLGATDFSNFSTEELSALRGSVATEEKDAFRSEWQSRMATMTPEERASYGVAQQRSSTNTNGQRLRDGSGLGSKSMGANKGGRR